MTDEVFYTDETKLKDLTVGQLKDIIIETLNNNIAVLGERRVYEYQKGYQVNPVYPDPLTTVYCEAESDKLC